MRVHCNLRVLRGTRSLRDMQRLTLEHGCEVSAGILSQLERGVMLPPDRQLAALEAAYGVGIEDWYDRRTLVVLQADGDDA